VDLWEALRAAWHLLVTLDPRVLSATAVSLRVSLAATLASAVLGMPVGFWVAAREFRGRHVVEVCLRTLTALPTVVVGLLTYALLSRGGPLGALRPLYTQGAMVLGEMVLVTPLMATSRWRSSRAPTASRRPLTLGALGCGGAHRVVRGAPRRCRRARDGQRLISELGIALMVGGNIRDATRTMTTAIALESSKGEFALGFALGLILLAVALGINVGAAVLTPRR
jgi:tungstate transport system permease protein